MWWSLWWVWMVGALLLAILEVLAPAQIFLGFAAGAAGVGLALLIGRSGFGRVGACDAFDLCRSVADCLVAVAAADGCARRPGQTFRARH